MRIRKFNESRFKGHAIDWSNPPHMQRWEESHECKKLGNEIINRNEIEEFLYDLENEPNYSYALTTKLNFSRYDLMKGVQKIITIHIKNEKKKSYAELTPEIHLDRLKKSIDEFKSINGIIDRMESMLDIKFQNFNTSENLFVYSHNSKVYDERIREEYLKWLFYTYGNEN
jgi:hypothetical protein